jgi:hypothetical protein
MDPLPIAMEAVLPSMGRIVRDVPYHVPSTVPCIDTMLGQCSDTYIVEWHMLAYRL